MITKRGLRHWWSLIRPSNECVHAVTILMTNSVWWFSWHIYDCFFLGVSWRFWRRSRAIPLGARNTAEACQRSVALATVSNIVKCKVKQKPEHSVVTSAAAVVQTLPELQSRARKGSVTAIILQSFCCRNAERDCVSHASQLGEELCGVCVCAV